MCHYAIAGVLAMPPPRDDIGDAAAMMLPEVVAISLLRSVTLIRRYDGLQSP